MPQQTIDLVGLDRFSRTVWDDPQALLEHLPPQGVEFINLGEFYDPLARVFTSILKKKRSKILVRNEYRTALQTLQTAASYEGGAYVTGQPGIGKTYFLIYLIVTHLHQRRPIALHLLSGEPFYVLFKRTATLHPVTDVNPLLECGSVWVLCDSNSNISSPPGALMQDTSRIRILQTTPPTASRWKEWSEQAGASCYIMDIWTENEIENLAVLVQRDVGRMIELARKWGCVPRTLLWALDEPDEEVECRYRDGAQAAIAECEHIMDGGRKLDLPSPSLFYFIRPRTLDSGTLSRKLACVSVPTDSLYMILAEGLQKRNSSIRAQIYTTLSQCPETSQGAGRMYESWFYSFVSAGGKVPCRWISLMLGNDIMLLPTELPRAAVLPPSTLDVLATKPPPYFWFSPYNNFPGIDSALVLEKEKEIFAFQVTVGAGHKSPIEGLSRLRKSLPVNLKNLFWRVVFIGPDADHVKRVAQYWAGKLRFPKRKRRVMVGWSAVDPVQNEVSFKAYHAGHYQTGPVPEESNEEDEEDDSGEGSDDSDEESDGSDGGMMEVEASEG